MGAEANAECVRRILEEAWNQGNLSVLDEVCARRCIEHDLSTHEELYGVEASKERVRTYRDAMPDLHMTIDDLVADDDKVVTRWRVTGTNDGDLMGNPPSHRHVEFTGITIDRFGEDGRLAEAWDQWDLLSFMQQLGLGPAVHAYV